MALSTNITIFKRRQGMSTNLLLRYASVLPSFSFPLCSRANHDAINVHPLEFFLGEYNHLLAVYLCCHHFNLQVHALSTVLFLGIGGVLAGWNHTRFDIEFAPFGIMLFDSKAHDVHHRIPQSNYGQYTMFWDRVFGTYR